MASAFDIIQIVVEFTMLGQQLLNVYHAICTETELDANLMTDLTNKLDGAYSNIENRQADDLVAIGLTFKNLTDETLMGVETFPNYIGGTDNTNDPLPPGVALVATFPTAVLKTRGRKFIPGIAENGTSGGLFVSGVMTDVAFYVADIATPFIGPESDAPILFGVVDLVGAFKGFTAGTASNIPGYQRRRKQGVGA